LNITDSQQTAFSNLVRETGALYGSRHYRTYHFLLTLSDQVAHFGLEHHESSDDRVEARTLIDGDMSMLEGSLLPHEFTHSWNGKYRRPAGLVTTDYQHPMKGELLWVYEGMTQYWGDVLAARSGIWTADQFKSYLASSAAELDHRPGRTWRNLQDTATAAQILYSTPKAWDNWRREVDYYQEGELIWLEADTIIRKLSGGNKSLNDFCLKFLGPKGNSNPQVVPYSFDDVVRDLNAVQAYDWAAFLRERLQSTSPHAPLAGITNSGYRIEYTKETNEFIHAAEGKGRGINAWYSLGFETGSENTIEDVLVDSPAYRAGLGPGMKLVAINGRRATEDLLHESIQGSLKSTDSLELIVENDGFFKVVKIDYHSGEKYPHLVKEAKAHTVLDDILEPMVSRPSADARAY
jgi:predicted metalloprotease with PDZ domain